MALTPEERGDPAVYTALATYLRKQMAGLNTRESVPILSPRDSLGLICSEKDLAHIAIRQILDGVLELGARGQFRKAAKKISLRHSPVTHTFFVNAARSSFYDYIEFPEAAKGNAAALICNLMEAGRQGLFDDVSCYMEVLPPEQKGRIIHTPHQTAEEAEAVKKRFVDTFVLQISNATIQAMMESLHKTYESVKASITPPPPEKLVNIRETRPKPAGPAPLLN